MKKRNDVLDATRALCMLWIVGVWHLQEYVVNQNSWNNPYTACITVGVLSMFTFLSGYFLSGKTEGAKGFGQFYKKRLLRFYPLFFVSCLSLFFVSKVAGARFFQDFRQLGLTLTGLSCFVKPYPPTVWYFAMLIIFYAVTPLINLIEAKWGKGLLAVGIYSILIFSVQYGEADPRILIYFPIYGGALIFHDYLKRFFSGHWSGLGMLLSMGLCIASIVLCVKLGSSISLQLIVAVLSIVPLYYCGALLNKNQYIRKLSLLIGYASMCSYLFHRQFYGLMKAIIGDFSYAVAYCVVLPLMVVLGFCIQKTYDYCISKLLKRGVRT